MQTIKSLFNDLKKIKPKNREEMKKIIASILKNNLDVIIDTHNTKSIIFIFTINKNKYLIKTEYGSIQNSIKNEINWFLNISKKIHKYHPKIIYSMVNSNYAFYIQSYIDNSSTIDDQVYEKKINNSQTYNLIKRSLNLDKLIFNTNVIKKYTINEADKLFIGKYEERIKEAKKYIFLKKLFSQKIITINNIQYKNLDFYISIIRNNNKLKSLLTPIMFGLIHGDLHCGNILIKSDNIYFVDPNGNLFMPLEYDYGKIFHSINGGYGSIMRKKFKLETKSINKYVFSLNLPKEYTYTFKQIVKEIPLDVFIKSFYSQAMHFATMIPHHAKDEKETTAIFLRSIQLFNELFKLVALTEQL